MALRAPENQLATKLRKIRIIIRAILDALLPVAFVISMGWRASWLALLNFATASYTADATATILPVPSSEFSPKRLLSPLCDEPHRNR